MIEIIGFVSTCLAVAGVWFNNNLDIRCFYIWFASNFLCAYIHWRKRVWSLMIRDIVFIGLAVDGLIRWSNG